MEQYQIKSAHANGLADRLCDAHCSGMKGKLAIASMIAEMADTGECAVPHLGTLVTHWLKDDHQAVRRALLELLHNLEKHSMPYAWPIAMRLRDPETANRRIAVGVLEFLITKGSAPRSIKVESMLGAAATKDKDPEVRTVAMRILSLIGVSPLQARTSTERRYLNGRRPSGRSTSGPVATIPVHEERTYPPAPTDRHRAHASRRYSLHLIN